MTKTNTKPPVAKASAIKRSTKRERTQSPAGQATEWPSPNPPSLAEGEAVRQPTKIDQVVAMLKREGGATSADLMAATGWQAHSVRGAIAGTVKKKLGLVVVSAPSDLGRVYSIAGEQPA
ncbi:DUF3489 domain-containing protein [Brevundimonas sp. Leaf363]|uniref:DUF3489 domain-containing protein n=1 Tax=Brevundimonas sp. Leaf363 TaxID=1736353 RepID=UPI0009E94427|nr:DUF3489 domain-containing protein [Brevundimonas sp. Leaf363]